MIDLRMLRDDPDRVRASQRARGESESAVDDLLRADEERRSNLQRFEALRAEQIRHGLGANDEAHSVVDRRARQMLHNGAQRGQAGPAGDEQEISHSDVCSRQGGAHGAASLRTAPTWRLYASAGLT